MMNFCGRGPKIVTKLGGERARDNHHGTSHAKESLYGVWFLAASQLLGFGKAIIIRGGAGCRFSPAHIWTITLGKEESTLIGKTRSRKTGFYVHLHARKKIPRMVLLILFYSVQPIADECVVLL